MSKILIFTHTPYIGITLVLTIQESLAARHVTETLTSPEIKQRLLLRVSCLSLQTIFGLTYTCVYTSAGKQAL